MFFLYTGTAEFVIPTPSIDQVLQSLASNALASNASDENEGLIGTN